MPRYRKITIIIKGVDLCAKAFIRNHLAPAISAGPIEHMEKGWAVMPFVGGKAHYWVEDKDTMPPKIRYGERVRYYKSHCGISAVTNNKVPALQPGSWPRCKRCNTKAHR